MVSKLIWIVTIAALFSAAFKAIFPQARHWIPVLIATVFLPLISAMLTIYRMLVEVGISAVDRDTAPPGTIDKFASGMNSVMLFVPIAAILVASTSFAVLRFMANRKTS